MFFKRLKITNYRNFNNIEINFKENKEFPSVYSIASINGGGKSTLLQFIFTLLHCFSNKQRLRYIKNLLNGYSFSEGKKINLADFLIDYDGSEYILDFFIVPSEFKGLNLNVFVDIDSLSRRIEIAKTKYDKFKQVLLLQEEINNYAITDKVPINFVHDLRSISHFIDTRIDRRLYSEAEASRDIDSYKKLLSSIISTHNISLSELDELELIYDTMSQDLLAVKDSLEKNGYTYITHLNSNRNVLVLRSNADVDIFNKISSKIFLTAPSTQIFLFLSPEERQEIFSSFSYGKRKNELFQQRRGSAYEVRVGNSKRVLPGFSTYDFASTDLILESFTKASAEDLKEKRKNGKYGEKYDQLTKELKNFLEDKEISEDDDGEKVIFKLKGSNKILSPEDLSHGELKKLSIYIWLKYIVDTKSIVLMDEVDIALHPKWQYQLIDDLVNWSPESQFIIGTHSPQILSSTYYGNIIKLNRNDSKTTVEQFDKPPLDRDLNSIVTEIMGSPEYPAILLKLHKTYRDLVEKNEYDSIEAKKIKKEILEYESENSSFFQDINFEISLKS